MLKIKEMKRKLLPPPLATVKRTDNFKGFFILMLLIGAMLSSQNVDGQCFLPKSAPIYVHFPQLLPITQQPSTVPMAAGEYYDFSAVEGVLYTFSFCKNGGLVIPSVSQNPISLFTDILNGDNVVHTTDLEITILDKDGKAVFGYSDNGVNCGSAAPHLEWRAPYDGQYKVLVTKKTCVGSGENVGYMSVKMTPPIPSNDARTSAISLSNLPYGNGGSTRFATPSAGFPNQSNDVWYSFVGNGKAWTITTRGDRTNFKTRLAVYPADVNLSPIVADEDDNNDCGPGTSTVFFPTSNGATYYVRVYGAGTENGSFTIGDFYFTEPPSNDLCSAPQSLSLNNTPVSGNTTYATPSGVTLFPYDGNSRDVWYTYTGDGNRCRISPSNVQSSTGIPFHTKLIVYQGGCDNLTKVAYAAYNVTGADVDFQTVNGYMYLVCVCGDGPNEYGSFTIKASSYTAPNNDFIAEAIELSPENYVEGSTTNATQGEGLELYTYPYGPNKSVWYKMTGNGNKFTVSTYNTYTNFTTRLFVYKGSATGGITRITNSTRVSGAPTLDKTAQEAIFYTSPGVPYFIRVDGPYPSDFGNFRLTATQTTAPVPNPSYTPEFYVGSLGGAFYNTSICANSTRGVDLTVTDGTPNNSYVWSPIPSSDGRTSMESGGITIMAKPTTTTTYTVTASKGSMSTAYITVHVNQVPNITATAELGATSRTICVGQTSNLNANLPNAPSGLMQPSATYTWSPGNLTGASVVVSPTASTTYTLTGTNQCGSSTATIGVVVNPLPNVTASADKEIICSGESVTLTGAGASTYVWAGGIENNKVFSPSLTSVYTVTGTDRNGCTNTASKTVTVKQGVRANVVLEASASNILAGKSVALITKGVPADATYQWSSSPADRNVSNKSVSNFIVTPPVPEGNNISRATTYTVTATTGCNASTATVTVTTNNPGFSSDKTTGELNMSTDLNVVGGDIKLGETTTSLQNQLSEREVANKKATLLIKEEAAKITELKRQLTGQ